MKIYFYRAEDGTLNYGDELNRVIWPALLPRLHEAKPLNGQFIGIGSVLRPDMPLASRNVVFGAGMLKPWAQWPGGLEIRFVRGPLSSQVFDGAPYITDPGILIADLYKPAGTSFKVGLMPHWRNASPWLKQVCDDAGVRYIDPRGLPAVVTAELAACDTIMAQAMHGAIVADAFRRPWTPLENDDWAGAFKWHDWCNSMELPYRPAPISLKKGWLRAGRLSKQLRMLAGCNQWLSKDKILEQKLDQLHAEVKKLNEEIDNG